VAAVAQPERDLIRERVSAGIRNVRVAGKQLGRSARIVDREQILRLRYEGVSIEQIAAKVGVGAKAVYEAS
jgi:DNA invertase Pin-like site-specific DNA recombinase